VVWVCGTAATPSSVTIQGSGATNIPAAYLPNSCHA
jgi:hypothetical protein